MFTLITVAWNNLDECNQILCTHVIVSDKRMWDRISNQHIQKVRMGPECSCCHKDSERCIIANGHHTKSAQQYRGEGVYIYYIYIYIYIPVYIHCIDILYEHSGAH